jgi:hypothetical protein
MIRNGIPDEFLPFERCPLCQGPRYLARDGFLVDGFFGVCRNCWEATSIPGFGIPREIRVRVHWDHQLVHEEVLSRWHQHDPRELVEWMIVHYPLFTGNSSPQELHSQSWPDDVYRTLLWSYLFIDKKHMPPGAWENRVCKPFRTDYIITFERPCRTRHMSS